MIKFMRAILALSLIMIVPMTAFAGLRQDADTALEAGADVHLDRQGTYSVGVPSTAYCGEANNTWEWRIGSGTTCRNVLGISATGLLAAYDRLGHPEYFDGAELAGGELINRYDSDPGRPFAQDVEFLHLLANQTGDIYVAGSASDYYQRVIDQFTAEENVDRHIDGGRGGLSGWDISSHIRGALASGYWQYAYDMAYRLVERRDDWEGVPLGGYDYTTHSWGSLLWALRELGSNDFDDYVDEVRGYLVASQLPDGSWEDGDYQATSYVLLGLNALHNRDKPRRAINNGIGYLVATQEDGGWSYDGTEYGEVNSEALMALGWVRADNGRRPEHANNKSLRISNKGRLIVPML